MLLVMLTVRFQRGRGSSTPFRALEKKLKLSM